MASKIRGVYEERWDTPPIVEEYKQAKLSRARSRWRAYKYITYGVTAAAAALVLLDESISGKRAAANANYGLGGLHRLKVALLEAWAEDRPMMPVVAQALEPIHVEREYPHFTPLELRHVERRLIADGLLSEADLTPLPEGVQEAARGGGEEEEGAAPTLEAR